MPRKKSKKLKQLEDKLKIIKKEIARRKKLSASSSAPSKSKRSRKSAKSPFEECKTLLDKIKKIQYSKPFLDPVDWKALNIPTYPHIIKHPMDLHTIESKLTNNQYHNPYQFSNDMRLVYQNATTFNKPSTQYYMSATKFGKKFEEEFERKVVDQHETNSFTRKIHKVVSSLIRRDDSIPFRAPVNPQVLEIPDYLDVIDTPMDLGTILNKISYYTQFKHFVHDLFLVWDNCCRYNPKQNQIHQTALKLREYTQKQLNRLCPSEFQAWQEDDNASPPAYAPSSLQMQEDHETKAEATSASMTAYSGAQTTLAPGPAAHLPSDSDPNMNVTMDRNDTVDTEMSGAYNDANDHEMQNMNEEADTASDDIFKICDEMSDEEEGNKMMISYLVKKKELNPDRCGSLDFHQKEELQRGIQCLDSDHFDPLINMLQSFIPEGEGEDDEVELDVDSIDDGLQVKMYNYMLQAIHQQEDERIKREGGNTNMNNAMDIDSHDQLVQEEDSTAVTPIVHANGKGGIHDTNHNNNMMSHEQQQHVEDMNNMNQDDEEELDMSMEAQPTELPNVVTSFPTTASSSIPPSIPQNMPNVEPPPEDHDMNHNENEYTFSAVANQEQEEEEDEEEENDVEMAMNMDAEAQNEDVNDGNDIIADIENAVATNVNDSLSMPVLESNDHEEEQKMEMTNDNTNNSNEAQTSDPVVETEHVASSNTNEVAPIIPTMPALSADDNEEDDGDGGEFTIEKEDANEVNAPQDTSVVDLESNVIKSQAEQPIVSVNDNGMDESNKKEEQEGNEDEDVDTPLADDIDF
eukprot:175410_1